MKIQTISGNIDVLSGRVDAEPAAVLVRVRGVVPADPDHWAVRLLPHPVQHAVGLHHLRGVARRLLRRLL